VTPRRDDGFGLVPAVFLLVILALGGAVMLRMVGVQNATASLSLQGARAYWAARSGVEWGIREAVTAAACPAPTTLSLNEGGLRGFSVDVSCTSSAHDDGGAIATTYRISSVASYGSYGGRDHVRRRLHGTVTDAP
jgi:MSHA biogenesis protein MshP